MADTLISTTLLLAILAIIVLAVAVVILLPQNQKEKEEKPKKQQQPAKKPKKENKQKNAPKRAPEPEQPQVVETAKSSTVAKRGVKQQKPSENDDAELLGLVQHRETNAIAPPSRPEDKKKKTESKQAQVAAKSDDDEDDVEDFTLVKKVKKTKEEKKAEEEQQKQERKRRKMFFKKELMDSQRDAEREQRKKQRDEEREKQAQERAERRQKAEEEGASEDKPRAPRKPREVVPDVVVDTNFEPGNLDEMLNAMTSFYTSHDSVFKKLDKTLVVRILAYLSIRDLAAVAKVDHFLNSAVKSQGLWRDLLYRDFGVKAAKDLKGKTNRQVYKQHFKSAKKQ